MFLDGRCTKHKRSCTQALRCAHPECRRSHVPTKRSWLQVQGLERPKRVFQCQTPEEVRATLPEGKDVLAFQCRNPIHKAHYELFIRALEADNVGKEAVCIVHPTCGPTQDDDIPGIVRYQCAACVTNYLIDLMRLASIADGRWLLAAPCDT